MRNPAQLRMTVLAMLLPAMVFASPKVIYVDQDAPGVFDGTSWLNAHHYLQDALAEATAGDIIKVAQGTYRPNQATIPMPGGRDVSFKLKTGVRIQGGYAGYGEPDPNLRDWALFKTLLSGDLDSNDVFTDVSDYSAMKGLLTHSSRQENAYTVVDGSGTEPNTVLEGFVITAGNSNGSQDWPYVQSRGGGLDVNKGEPTIKSCAFQLNSAADGGGAIYAYMSEPEISDCNVADNYSEEYGAGVTNWAAEPTILTSTFMNNMAGFQAEGGAVYNFDSNPQIEDCAFVRNYGGHHGGGIYNAYSSPTVINCTFVENTARTSGAAVSNSTGSPRFDHCTFLQNSATDWGGGMMNDDCTPTVTNCEFIGNSSGQIGGGMHNWMSEPILINCLFNGNTADAGGALGCDNTQIRMTNCTLTSNKAPQGNGVACNSPIGSTTASHVIITNCIMWDTGTEIYNGDSSEIDVNYTDIYGTWPGTGNIAVNPMFVNLKGSDDVAGNEDDNLRLSNGSPCIDAGSNYALPAYITKDLAGKTRRQDNPSTPDTGSGTPPIVDMGAYEYQVGSVPSNKPLADAGEDRTVYAGTDSSAEVTLDGSGSYDPSGYPLAYLWTWVIDSTTYEAMGVNPSIQLPIGVHTITLIVSNGFQTSNPDQVTITVVSTIDVHCELLPYLISRTDPNTTYVLAILWLPGIPKASIDMDQALLMNPGGVPAFDKHAFESYSGGTLTTFVIAMFNKNQVLSAIPLNGVMNLTVVGQLKFGPSFSGSDTVQISN